MKSQQHRIQGHRHYRIRKCKSLHWHDRAQFQSEVQQPQSFFQYRKHSCTTVVSKCIWNLKEVKDSNIDFSTKWCIITRVSSSRGNPSHCNLCLTEKLCILSTGRSTLLNKRPELITKCRHENKLYAANQIQHCSTRPP